MGEWREPTPADYKAMSQDFNHEHGTLPGDEALEPELATQVTRVFFDRIVPELGHSPRVQYEKTGDNISQRLSFDADTDPALFVEELRGLTRVELEMRYALEGT